MLLGCCNLRFILVFMWLILSFKHVEGQHQVICSPETVVAFPGDDVILLCRVQPRLNVTGFALEWSKPELQSDPNDPLSQEEFVHISRDSKEFLDMKMPSYVGRTSILEGGLRDGIISLKITNVTLADEGKYKCFIPKLDSQNRSAVVYLVIRLINTRTAETPGISQTDNPINETAPTDGASARNRLVSVAVLCVLLILCIGVTLKQRCIEETHKSTCCLCALHKGTCAGGSREESGAHLEFHNKREDFKAETCSTTGGHPGSTEKTAQLQFVTVKTLLK